MDNVDEESFDQKLNRAETTLNKAPPKFQMKSSLSAVFDEYKIKEEFNKSIEKLSSI